MRAVSPRPAHGLDTHAGTIRRGGRPALEPSPVHRVFDLHDVGIAAAQCLVGMQEIENPMCEPVHLPSNNRLELLGLVEDGSPVEAV